MSTSDKATSPSHSSEAAQAEGRYHHGNLREALVEAGLVLLESQASADFSLRELARQVGVSPNATYRHFANKEALMAAMAAEGFRRFAAAQQKAYLRECGPRQRFMAAGHAYVRFARDNPALFRLMFGPFTANHRTPEMESAGTVAFAGLCLGVAAVMELSPEDPQVMAAALHAWSVAHGLSHLLLDGQLQHFSGDLETLVDTALRQVISIPAQREG